MMVQETPTTLNARQTPQKRASPNLFQETSEENVFASSRIQTSGHKWPDHAINPFQAQPVWPCIHNLPTSRIEERPPHLARRLVQTRPRQLESSFRVKAVRNLRFHRAPNTNQWSGPGWFSSQQPTLHPLSWLNMTNLIPVFAAPGEFSTVFRQMAIWRRKASWKLGNPKIFID